MRWITLLTLLCGLSAVVLAADKENGPALAPEEIKEGFVRIFDGKTLNGWKGATTGYVAENGLLVCQKKGGGNFFTTREYGDFIFRFEYKLEPGGNNGVSVRGQEIQILDDDAPRHSKLKPCQYHGSIYCKVPAKRGHTKPPGEWNAEEILVQGSHWKVSVNGTVIVDVDLATKPELTELARRTRGALGFLGHGALVEFRNLRVKEL